MAFNWLEKRTENSYSSTIHVTQTLTIANNSTCLFFSHTVQYTVKWTSLRGIPIFWGYSFWECGKILSQNAWNKHCVSVEFLKHLGCARLLLDTVDRRRGDYPYWISLTGRNRTGPPCSVSCPTAHAPSGRPACPPAALQTTDADRRRRPTDDDRHQRLACPLHYV